MIWAVLYELLGHQRTVLDIYFCRHQPQWIKLLNIQGFNREIQEKRHVLDLFQSGQLLGKLPVQ